MAPPRIVFLQGLGGTWAPQLAAFDRSVAPSLPGFGDEPGPFTLARAFAAVDRVAEDRIDLCGLSLGAQVALAYALEHPARVRRLVVCAAFARLPPRLLRRQELLARILGVLPSRLTTRGFGDVRLDRRELAALVREISRLDLADRVRMLDVPALVLCGERDRANLPLSRELAALLPDARFELVPGGGHVANVDAPDAFTRLVRDFL